ncbi:MAG: DMT family transporter [Candidatus Beckwithbacteria bacterium]
MWLILALVTAVFWAMGNVLIKKSVGSFPKSLVYFSSAVFFLILWTIYYLIFKGWQFDWLALGIAILPPISFIYVLTALSKADASLVLALGAINPLVTAVLAVSFLGESLSLWQWGLVITVILGVMIMSYSGKLKPGVWVWWGAGYGLLAGFINFISKFAIERSNSMSYSLMIAVWQILIAVLFLTVEKQWGRIKNLVLKSGRSGLIGTGLFNVGSVAFFLALGIGAVSLIMPVVNLSTPMILVLAAWWLKEKTSLRQKIGAGIIIISVMALSLMS